MALTIYTPGWWGNPTEVKFAPSHTMCAGDKLVPVVTAPQFRGLHRNKENMHRWP